MKDIVRAKAATSKPT